MAVLRFVPARDQRHRHACLALYRALLNAARNVRLPDDVLATTSCVKPNPVQQLVTGQFRRNKGDTSPRLVFASLKAGYKFLSLFKAAETVPSEAYDEISQLIRQRFRPGATQQTHRRRNHKSFPPRPQHNLADNPRRPPLLTRHVSPEGEVSYKPTVRPLPLSQLKGSRRIPKVVVTASGIPFLCMRKPQPYAIYRMIRRKSRARLKQIDFVQSWQTEGYDAATSEDRWENAVQNLLARSGTQQAETRETLQSSYRASQAEVLASMGRRFQEVRLDDVARAKALVDLVEQEKRLAREERAHREELKRERRLKRREEEGRDAILAAGSEDIEVEKEPSLIRDRKIGPTQEEKQTKPREKKQKEAESRNVTLKDTAGTRGEPQSLKRTYKPGRKADNDIRRTVIQRIRHHAGSSRKD